MKKLDKENLHKEIDLIQACINRMAKNSFLLKGWTISIISVSIALFEKDVNLIILCLLVLIPLISFWYLDAFFLYTERLYREMYDWVLKERTKLNSEYMYDLNPHRFKDKLKIKKDGRCTNKIETELTVMFSKTLRYFYLIPMIFVIIMIIYLIFLSPSLT